MGVSFLIKSEGKGENGTDKRRHLSLAITKCREVGIIMDSVDRIEIQTSGGFWKEVQLTLEAEIMGKTEEYNFDFIHGVPTHLPGRYIWLDLDCIQTEDGQDTSEPHRLLPSQISSFPSVPASPLPTHTFSP